MAFSARLRGAPCTAPRQEAVFLPCMLRAPRTQEAWTSHTRRWKRLAEDYAKKTDLSVDDAKEELKRRYREEAEWSAHTPPRYERAHLYEVCTAPKSQGGWPLFLPRAECKATPEQRERWNGWKQEQRASKRPKPTPPAEPASAPIAAPARPTAAAPATESAPTATAACALVGTAEGGCCDEPRGASSQGVSQEDRVMRDVGPTVPDLMPAAHGEPQPEHPGDVDAPGGLLISDQQVDACILSKWMRAEEQIAVQSEEICRLREQLEQQAQPQREKYEECAGGEPHDDMATVGHGSSSSSAALKDAGCASYLTNELFEIDDCDVDGVFNESTECDFLL